MVGLDQNTRVCTYIAGPPKCGVYITCVYCRYFRCVYIYVAVEVRKRTLIPEVDFEEMASKVFERF